MKQKSADTDTVTKQDLLETKQDLLDAFKDFGKEFRTEMKQEILASERRMLAKMAIKFADSEYRMKDHVREQISIVLNRFDAWAGEMENARTNRTLSTEQLRKLRLTTENHEKRLAKLEKN